MAQILKKLVGNDRTLEASESLNVGTSIEYAKLGQSSLGRLRGFSKETEQLKGYRLRSCNWFVAPLG